MWAAFLAFVQIPIEDIDVDEAPVDLIEDDDVVIGFSRNLFRAWSEAYSGDPIRVLASFHWPLTDDLRGVTGLALSGTGGPRELGDGPLRLLGVGRPRIAAGRLGEAVDAHPDFARGLATPGATAAFVAVTDPTEDGD